MELLGTPIITPDWVQAGELGLAFVVVLMSASLVVFVMKTSAAREKEYLRMIAKFMPMMENLSNSMDTMNTNMAMIGTRLEHIEGNQVAFMPRSECKILDSLATKINEETVK